MATALMRIVASRRRELELPYLMTMAPRKLTPKLQLRWRSWLLQVPNHANANTNANAICNSQKYLAHPALSLIHVLCSSPSSVLDDAFGICGRFYRRQRPTAWRISRTGNIGSVHSTLPFYVYICLLSLAYWRINLLGIVMEYNME